MEKKFASRKPNGFREGFDGELACCHRDISTCDDCANKYANIVECYGAHYWFRNAQEVDAYNAEISAVLAEFA